LFRQTASSSLHSSQTQSNKKQIFYFDGSSSCSPFADLAKIFANSRCWQSRLHFSIIIIVVEFNYWARHIGQHTQLAREKARNQFAGSVVATSAKNFFGSECLAHSVAELSNK